jgi:hypothetical protein
VVSRRRGWSIDQYRGGLAGGTNKNKREFPAFHDEALAAEKPGTGRFRATSAPGAAKRISPAN